MFDPRAMLGFSATTPLPFAQPQSPKLSLLATLVALAGGQLSCTFEHHPKATTFFLPRKGRINSYSLSASARHGSRCV